MEQGIVCFMVIFVVVNSENLTNWREIMPLERLISWE